MMRGLSSPSSRAAFTCTTVSRRPGGSSALDLTSPDGIPITIRPIEPDELDRIVLRCWPSREALGRLFAGQGTIGLAAWEGDMCVAQLRCYRVSLPDWRSDD